MNIKNLFFPLLVVVALAALSFGRLQELGNKGSTLYLTEDFRGAQLLRQGGTKRTWREETRIKTLSIESRPDVTLYGPLHLRIDDDDNLLVRDSGDLAIKTFDAEGRLLRIYGQVRGQGPGEFASLTDAALGPNGEVWAADATNGRITIFNPDGEIRQTLRMPLPPYRLSVGHQGDGFFVMNTPGSELFARFDAAGDRLATFGTFLENQGVNAMALDGLIEPDGDGGFIYGARYAGLLAGYDSSGTVRFFAETVDHQGLPKLNRNGGQTWIDRETVITIHSLSVTSEGLHVLATEEEGFRLRGAIDTYSLSDGRYLYSRRLPEACTSVKLSTHHLYTVTETHISRWTLTHG